MLGASRSALRFGLRSLATKARINAPPLVVITGEEYTNYASELYAQPFPPHRANLMFFIFFVSISFAHSLHTLLNPFTH